MLGYHGIHTAIGMEDIRVVTAAQAAPRRLYALTLSREGIQGSH